MLGTNEFVPICFRSFICGASKGNVMIVGQYKLQNNSSVHSINYVPGPASTVEERSLRKIFVRGDRGSNLTERIYLFRRVRERKKSLMETSNEIGLVTSYLATSTRKSCCDQFYCIKGNVAWINRSYDVIFIWRYDVIYPTTQFYSTLATWNGNQLS